jgi:hypothetical protein
LHPKVEADAGSPPSSSSPSSRDERAGELSHSTVELAEPTTRIEKPAGAESADGLLILPTKRKRE